MANSILQEYLTLQFIPMDDQTGVDKLIKSAGIIEKKLRKEKAQIASYTLVALDPQTRPDDQVLIDVQAIITQNWSVYVNKAGGNNLITYNRAVILEALSRLASEIDFAGIIWLTGSSVIKHYTLGREESVLTQWLLNIGNFFEGKARELWAVNDIKLETTLPEIKSSGLELKTYSVNKETLKKGLRSAGGQTFIDDEGTNTTGDVNNRYWPNNNANWSGDFGKIAADAIAAQISAVFTANNKEIITYLKSTQEIITAFLTQLNPLMDNISGAMLNKSNSLDKRSQLLWIKESQYSMVLGVSYRIMDKNILPLAVAKDICDTMQPVYPASVDYFAKEIARVSSPDIEDPKNVQELLSPLLDDKNAIGILGQSPEFIGRCTFHAFLVGFANKSIRIDQLTQLTGIPSTAEISKAELITWLIHDLQALKLINKK